MMTQTTTSWWTLPDVQWDRDAFRAAQIAQEPRWKAREADINRLLNNVMTADWQTGSPKRRGMPNNRIGVTL